MAFSPGGSRPPKMGGKKNPTRLGKKKPKGLPGVPAKPPIRSTQQAIMRATQKMPQVPQIGGGFGGGFAGNMGGGMGMPDFFNKG